MIYSYMEYSAFFPSVSVAAAVVDVDDSSSHNTHVFVFDLKKLGIVWRLRQVIVFVCK